jgi:iron complex outermembrane receptor protein
LRLAALSLPFLLPAAAAAQRPIDILHTPVSEAIEGKDVEINANIRRYREVNELVLYYRLRGAASYKRTSIPRSSSDFFEGKIPSADVRPPALEYYLTMIDRDGKARAGIGSAEQPLVIKVLPGGKQTATRTRLEEELAVFTEEEVISAAKQRQRIEESPSAITVITAEDIRNYGATSIAEVLRLVPGMDYMQISASDPNMSVRGFNRELSNRLLTLIDGRSAYIDVFGAMFWELFPISVWDIERIEVIRGPGSTLYGANAFGGVVNIFTKSPEQAAGMHFYTQGGDHGFTTTLLAAGKANDRTAYRFSVTHDQISSFDRVTIDEKIGVRGNALIRFDLPDNAKLYLRGGIIRENIGPVFSLNGPFTTEVSLGYAQVNLDWRDLRFQVWYTGIKGDLTRSFPIPTSLTLPGLGTIPFNKLFGDINIAPVPNARPDTVDVETTYTLEPSSLLRMTFGVNYRYNQFNIPTLLEPQNHENLLGVFGQFEIRPHPTLNINLGARFDLLSFANAVCPANALTDCLAGKVSKTELDNLLNFSPRGALVWGFAKEQYVRLSGGLAFRNPAFIENLIRYQIADAGTLPNGMQRPALIFAGNESLKAEQLRSMELGYGINLLNKRLRINVDLFYLEGIDLIQILPVDLLGALSGIPQAGSTYKNLVNARNYGFEVSVRAALTNWLKAFANYSWERVEIINKNDLKAGLLANQYGPNHPHCQSMDTCSLEDLTTIDTESPMHKINFGMNFAHAGSGFFLNLYGSFVGASKRGTGITSLPQTPVPQLGGVPLGAITGARSIQDIDAYFLLNANLGYRLYGGQLEIGVAGFNLLGAYDTLTGDGFDANGQLQSRRHIEYPRLSMQGQVFGGEAIGARVYGFIRGHFK